jgi:TonB family protein
MRSRHLVPAALLAFLILSTILFGDTGKLESALQTKYVGRSVRVQQPAADSGLQFEAPTEVREAIANAPRIYLQVRSVKLKKKRLELEAARASLTRDCFGRPLTTLGPERRYRIQWGDARMSTAALEEKLEKVLTLVDFEKESREEAKSRFQYPSPEPFAEKGKPRVSREVAPGVYTYGQGVEMPKCLSCRNPEYTEAARRAKVSGIVVVMAVVTEAGEATNLCVAKRLGYGLDEAALHEIAQWRFAPARRDGKPVALVMTLEVAFKLLN